MNIDCLIPAHKKDFNTLNLCVNGLKNNIKNLNTIFVVSNEDPKIDGITYIPQSRYDSYVNLQKIIEKYDNEKSDFTYRSGWIYQQFLKLLSSKVIQELTDSYLVVDADTIFVRPINFNPEKFYYCKANEYHLPYLTTIKKLLGVEETIGFSTISHHMIFNKNIMNEMIEVIMNNFHSNSFFDCVMSVIDYNELSSISEWDLYSNYAIKNYSHICEHRQLFWNDISYIPCQNDLDNFKEQLDFVSCHFYLRE